MRLMLTIMMALLWAMPLMLMAETYSWVDGQGTVNFTDDYSQVPRKYRTKVKRLDTTDEQPAPTSHEPEAGTANQSPQPQGGGNVVPPDAGSDAYGGRKAGVWQQEFRARGLELKRLEQQLVNLEALIKNPVGIPRERLSGLSQEFKDTQRQYNEALKRYNEFNDEANKAGLPAEFRK